MSDLDRNQELREKLIELLGQEMFERVYIAVDRALSSCGDCFPVDDYNALATLFPVILPGHLLHDKWAQ